MNKSGIRNRIPPHVMLVDDKQWPTQMMAHSLEKKAGYRVTPVYNGSDAIAMAISLKPSIIVMDSVFEGHSGPSGWEAARILRHTPETARIPIVLLTGIDPPDLQQAKRAGFNAVKSKPCTASELIPVIEQTLEENK